MKCVSKNSVFMYFDCREYLSNLLDDLRNEGNLSLRDVQEKLGVKGSGFFTRILNGSRPISLANAKIISSSLKMNEDETRYFITLVKFANEKNVDKREEFLKSLISQRSVNETFALQDSALAFFGKWYIPVIRDLLPLLPAKTSAQKVGRLMTPVLKASQVQGAIEYLLKSGFLEKKKDGSYKAVDPIVSTPPRVRSTILRKYHLKNLEINSSAYDSFSADERSLSSVTCSLSQESFEKVRDEIRLFRERVLAIAREDAHPDRVCHLGIQWMPRAVLDDVKEDENEKI